MVIQENSYNKKNLILYLNNTIYSTKLPFPGYTKDWGKLGVCAPCMFKKVGQTISRISAFIAITHC